MPKNLLYKPWKELRELQDRKLRYFVTKQLYPYSPYYRRLFDNNKINPNSIKTIKDLKNIPFTTKKDFITQKGQPEATLEFVLQPNEKSIKKYFPKGRLILSLIKGKTRFKKELETEYKPIFLTATAGTTNNPISFLYSSYDLENLKLSGLRAMQIFNIKQNEKALNIFPYAPHLAFWQTFFAGFSSCIFMLSTGGGKTIGTEGNIKAMLKVQPSLLIGVPSYVYHILKTARNENRDLSFLKKVALGAARVPKGFKRKLATLLNEMGSPNLKISGTYGFTESRLAWMECPTDVDTSSGYHTYPDMGIFEVIDSETGEVKKEGEDGELVYTSIDGRGSVVLRYRTGDLVKGGIVYHPCKYCGRTVPRISSDIVRASNIKNIELSKIKGTLVNLNTFEHFLDNEELIDEWQIEIRKKDNDPYEIDEMILYLSLNKSDIDKAEFERQLNRRIYSETDISFNRINIITRQEILRKIEIETSVKAKKVLDKRPKI